MDNRIRGTILITGGTGSLGQQLVETLLAQHLSKKIIVFSRDEWKQSEMGKRWPGGHPHALRYFLGDVRDRDRLHRALAGVDYVIHAAALKQVPSCEYNPHEAVKTNVLGTQNVIDAAIDRGVKRVLLVSSDKAVDPINLYGATKLVAEKLAVHACAYAGAGGPLVAVCRYGNVLGSRGSVLHLWREQAASGRIAVTDRRMTRFWITLPEAATFVLRSLREMRGGEIMIPKLPAASILELAAEVAPGCAVDEIGIRPGEKVHETLISPNEEGAILDQGDHFTVVPANVDPAPWSGTRMPRGFVYMSGDCAVQLARAAVRGGLAS